MLQPLLHAFSHDLQSAITSLQAEIFVARRQLQVNGKTDRRPVIDRLETAEQKVLLLSADLKSVFDLLYLSAEHERKTKQMSISEFVEQVCAEDSLVLDGCDMSVGLEQQQLAVHPEVMRQLCYWIRRWLIDHQAFAKNRGLCIHFDESSRALRFTFQHRTRRHMSFASEVHGDIIRYLLQLAGWRWRVEREAITLFFDAITEAPN